MITKPTERVIINSRRCLVAMPQSPTCRMLDWLLSQVKLNLSLVQFMWAPITFQSNNLPKFKASKSILAMIKYKTRQNKLQLKNRCTRVTQSQLLIYITKIWVQWASQEKSLLWDQIKISSFRVARKQRRVSITRIKLQVMHPQLDLGLIRLNLALPANKA